MDRFLESERQRQVEFKATSPYFYDAARAEGVYKLQAHAARLAEVEDAAAEYNDDPGLVHQTLIILTAVTRRAGRK